MANCSECLSSRDGLGRENCRVWTLNGGDIPPPRQKGEANQYEESSRDHRDRSAPNRSSLSEGSHLTGAKLTADKIFRTVLLGIPWLSPLASVATSAISRAIPPIDRVRNGVITSQRLNAKQLDDGIGDTLVSVNTIVQ